MLHQWICGGGTTPKKESLGLAAGVAKAMAVLVTVGCLLVPKHAQAAYASTLQTLYDAINGNALAQSTLATDLGSPSWVTSACTGAPSPINWFLGNITTALGGPASALATIQGAISLNVANTKTLQNVLGGSFFYNLSYWDCGGGDTGFALPQFVNGYDQLVNTIIAGQQNNSYITIIDALQGDPGAIKTLDTVLYHMIPGYGAVNHSTFLDALTDFVGTTTGTAATDNFSTGTCPAATASYTLAGTPVSLDSTRVSMTASDSFSGDGASSTYPVSFAPSPSAVVRKNGTLLATPADYTVAGNNITLTTVPSGTDIISLSDNITEYNQYTGTGAASYTVGFPLGPAKPTVTINGIVQPAGNYSIAGNTVTFATGIPASGTNVMIANYSVSGTALTFNNAPGCGYQMQASYTTGLGGGGTVAATIALFTAGLSGDTTSNNQINVIISNILTSNAASAPPLFINNGLSFVTMVPANPGGIKDTDGDGIPDSIDPDIDGDGIPNSYDLCPYDPTNAPGCHGTPANPDSDGDGIPDDVDSTPLGVGGVTIPPPGTPGTATGTGPGGAAISGGGSSKPPTDKCGSEDAPLTGDFGVDPCNLTTDNLNLTGNSDYWDEGGKQFADHIKNWWKDQFQPAMKNQTAQLNASYVDQSRQIGSTMDSHNVTKAATTTQNFELEDKTNLEPNERTCVGSTYNAPLSNLDYSGAALQGGLIFDVNNRTSGGHTAPLPKPKSPVQDLKNQFDTYCKYFNTAKANAGNNNCPSAATDGALPNGDIDVEKFLLRDTIDLSKDDEYAAVHAFLANVTHPMIPAKLPDDVIDTPGGKQYLLQQQHIEAIRNLAASVVAGIISRRASIPLPKEAGGSAPLPPATTPPPPPAPSPPTPGSSGPYTAFISALEKQESGGGGCITGVSGAGCENSSHFLGLLQWGEEGLDNLGCFSGPNETTYPLDWVGTWKGPCAAAGVNSVTAFLNNKALQDSLAPQWLSIMHSQAVSKGSWSYACTNQCGHWITPSGILACNHLLGAGGCHSWLSTCKTKTDKNGTTGGRYMDEFAGYDTPFSGPTCGPQAGQVGSQSGSATGSPPPPPKPVDETIYDIRHRAGVPDSQISCHSSTCGEKDPSYNEIMLALTKERFFDPDYYARMGNDVNQIKQEQTSVRAYISLQLQDIYMLQEQINALLAAKAAMTYDTSKQNNQSNSPMK